MKIEIDLNDILGDEYGSETLQESVRRQVIDNLTNVIKNGVGKKVEYEVAELINSEVRSAVAEKMPSLVDEILTTEYVTVDRYGNRSKDSTTVRKEIVSSVTEQMVYNKGNYSSDKNAFTRAVDEAVEAHVKEFKTQFNKLVDETFCAEAMNYAQKKLAERLGIKP